MPAPTDSQRPEQSPAEEGTHVIRNTRAEIDGAENTILAALDRFRYPESSRFAVRLALEEALNNAFGHGHETMPDAPVRLEYRATPDELTLVIEDQGPGFNPKNVADPTLDENLENASGRGMLLIRAYMTSVTWEGRGNRVRMVYRVPRSGDSASD